MKLFSTLILLIILAFSKGYSQTNYVFWHNDGLNAATFSVDDHASLDVTGDFTIEAWVKPPVTVADGGTFYIAERLGVFRLYLLVSGGTNLLARFDLVSGGTTISTGALTLGSWNHVAVSRSGTITRIFLNGSSPANSNLALIASSSICYIGGASTFFAAKKTLLDEVRFSNTARYTSNFTVDPVTGFLGITFHLV